MLGSQALESSSHPKSLTESETTQPVANHYLKKLFIWIGAWTLILISFISFIDPYGVSPLKIKLKGLNYYKPERLDIDRLIKPFEVWRYQPKTIFIGTSRIHQSLDPAIFDGTTYAPAYNAAIPASTLTENVANIEQFMKLDRNIKHIFVELFLYNFTQPFPEAKSKGWKQFFSNAASLLISSDALLNAIKTININWNINKSHKPIPAQIAERGYRLPKGDFNPGETFNDMLFIHTVLNWNASTHLSLKEDAFKPLDRILALAQQRGIQVHFFITPNYPWDDYRLMTLGYWPLLEKWLRKIATYPNVVSFSQYNQCTQEEPTLEPKMKWWNDPIHFNLNMGRTLLNTYLGNPEKNIPKNLMRILNTNTVETIIAKRKAGIIRWAANHPDFVMAFDDAKSVTNLDSGRLDLPSKTLFVNGKRHPIVLGEGEIAFTQKDNSSLIASGWTADELEKRPARMLIATIGNEVVAQGYPTVKRPDIELGFNKKGLTSGFSITIPLTKSKNSKPIRIFAIMRDGRAVQLVSEDKHINNTPIAAPLGIVTSNKLITGIKAYRIAAGTVGSVDKIALTPSEQSYRVDGWAYDNKSNTPVLAIIATDGKNILAKSVPTILKKNKRVGFSMLVPLDIKKRLDIPKLQLFALLSDGQAAPLTGNRKSQIKSYPSLLSTKIL